MLIVELMVWINYKKDNYWSIITEKYKLFFELKCQFYFRYLTMIFSLFDFQQQQRYLL